MRLKVVEEKAWKNSVVVVDVALSVILENEALEVEVDAHTLVVILEELSSVGATAAEEEVETKKA